MLSKRINVYLWLYAMLVVGFPLSGLVYALLFSVGLTGPLATGFTTSYWQQALSNTRLLISLGFSLYIAGITMLLSVAIALVLVLRYSPVLRRLPTILYVPLLFPALVMGFFVFQLLSRSGWLARISFQLGLIQTPEGFPDWVQDPAGIGIIIGHVFMAFPFFSILFLTLYDDARLSDYRALTQTLGASTRQFHWRVAIPILLRRASPTLVLYSISVFGAYDLPLLLGRPYPQMISVYITNRLQRFDLADLPNGYVAGVLISLILMLLIRLLTRLSQRHAL